MAKKIEGAEERERRRRAFEAAKAMQAEKKRIRSQRLPAWQRPPQENISRKPENDGPHLKKGVLDCKPIEMRFSIPLDARQQEEIREQLHPLLWHGKRRVTVTSDDVVVEGLLVRRGGPGVSRFR